MRHGIIPASAVLPQSLGDRQAGVREGNSFAVSYVSSTSVSVAAGTAFIRDLNAAFGGLTTDLVPARNASSTSVTGIPTVTNPRLDQIILTKPTVPGAVPTVVRVGGTETVGATLANRSGAVSDATLDSSYPQGWLRLADVLVIAASGVISANIRDRRAYASGGYGRSINTSTNYTQASGADITPTGGFRMEVNNSNAYEIMYRVGRLYIGGGGPSYGARLRVKQTLNNTAEGNAHGEDNLLYIFVAGASEDYRLYGGGAFTFTYFPAASGTCFFRPQIALDNAGVGGQTYNYPFELIVREIVSGLKQNGVN